MKMLYESCPSCGRKQLESRKCRSCKGLGVIPTVELYSDSLDRQTADLWFRLASDHLRGGRKSEPPAVRITINGDVGLLNTGEISRVREISAAVTVLAERKKVRIAEALSTISSAVLESDQLPGDLRQETLDVIAELATAAKTPKAKRTNVESCVNRLATLLGAGGGLAEIWSTWGPIIRPFFGV